MVLRPGDISASLLKLSVCFLSFCLSVGLQSLSFYYDALSDLADLFVESFQTGVYLPLFVLSRKC